LFFYTLTTSNCSAILHSFGKPVTLDAFGLVTQSNAPSFVPFNAASAPYGADGKVSLSSPSCSVLTPKIGSQSAFVTNEQQAQAYGSWIDSKLSMIGHWARSFLHLVLLLQPV
jgi:hypothetical protein